MLWSSDKNIFVLPRIIIVIFTCTILSAILFISLVNRPVYDDGFNIYDIHGYAQEGVSSTSLRIQRNAPGPGSFVWMAAGVRLLHDEELRDARLASLASWILLVVGILIAAPYTGFQQFWYVALLTALIFPYSAIATATLLTEGPAQLFAIMGVLVWTESVSRPKITPSLFILSCLAGLAMGLATISRQYYLALLPAAGAVALYQFKRRAPREGPRWMASIILSLVMAATPMLLLFHVWKGITSPSMTAGISYSNYQAGLGLNFLRPVVASFCIGFYLVPLTFPIMWQVHPRLRWRALLTASFIGIVAVRFRENIVNIGVLHSVIGTLSRLPLNGVIVFGFIAMVIVYNAIAFGLLVWEKRAVVLESPPVLFALLIVLFYVCEQLGVGGNIPFYDRYVFPLAPFMGMLAFALIPELTYPRLIVGSGMYLFSQGLLWRLSHLP
jgi:hypothetical protein